MSLNIGYLTSDRTTKGDEVYTPFYAVEPLIEFIPKDKIIWCPFDEDWSAFVQLFKERGYEVINSNLKNNQDFFEYEPEKYDIIISNPPFSKKDKVLDRLYNLNKPFAILLPIQTLQGKNRFKNFKNKDLQLLCFDSRIDYHTNNNFETYTKGNHFASAYFCKDILPDKLVFKELNKYERKLRGEL